MADIKLSPWKRGLRRAMLGGIEIHTRDRSLESGRRLAIHEYPKRNTPFPEDMGKATREYDLDAYVIGDNYMSQRDRLIKRCEREGAMSYIDHWGVSQRVKCRRIRLIETSEVGRMCRFSIDLVEAGEGGAAPFGVAATAVQLAGASAALISAVVSSFSSRFNR